MKVAALPARASLAALVALVVAAPAARGQEPVDPDVPPAVWQADAPPPAPPLPPPAPVLSPPAPPIPTIPVPTTRTVPGKIAYLRADGKAAIPRQAPTRVKRVIAAANEIVGKPYKWGGGHARLIDKGYDCSGTVGYALIRAGLLTTPMTSGDLARWGEADAGRHITIYANRHHVYMELVGLRLDTSPVADTQGTGPRWRQVIGQRPHFRVRHPLGL